MWRDRLVWVGTERLRLDPQRPVPLVVYPPPALTRARALEALERQGREWRIACTSGSLNGLIAATRAGLGVMAHTLGMIPPGLVRFRRVPGCRNSAGWTSFCCTGSATRAARGPAEALADAILAGGDRLHLP